MNNAHGPNESDTTESDTTESGTTEPGTTEPGTNAAAASRTAPPKATSGVSAPETGANGADLCELDPRKVRSRTRVLSAAADIMVESGPRAVTVDAVSERSGVAKSTIYRHWDSRGAIVIDVIRSHMPTIEAPTTTDFAEALRTTLIRVADAMSDPQWARMLPAFASLQVSMPELAELNRADSEQKMEMFRRVLQLGVDESRLADDVNEKQVLHLLVGPMVMATLGGYTETVHDLAVAACDQFLMAHPRPA